MAMTRVATLGTKKLVGSDDRCRSLIVLGLHAGAAIGTGEKNQQDQKRETTRCK
jgi:hypothetical protein